MGRDSQTCARWKLFLQVLGVAVNREGAAVENFKAMMRKTARPDAGNTFISLR